MSSIEPTWLRACPMRDAGHPHDRVTLAGFAGSRCRDCGMRFPDDILPESPAPPSAPQWTIDDPALGRTDRGNTIF
jgi:hypothetical protein